jgi:hypothetical protein
MHECLLSLEHTCSLHDVTMDLTEIPIHARMLDGVFIQKFCFDYGGDFSVLDTENRQYFSSVSLQWQDVDHQRTTQHTLILDFTDIDKCWGHAVA